MIDPDVWSIVIKEIDDYHDEMLIKNNKRKMNLLLNLQKITAYSGFIVGSIGLMGNVYLCRPINAVVFLFVLILMFCIISKINKNGE